jgi:hypothetical protein
MPVYKQSVHARSETHLDVPIFIEQTQAVEIGPGKREEPIELADTSRKSVKEWARSVRSSRKVPPPVYVERDPVERSWLEDGPASPDLSVPVRARFE